MSNQFCRYFQRQQCTGCGILQMPYAEQLQRKGEYVSEILEEALKADRATLLPPARSPLPMGYRSSVKLCLHEDREGREAVGLYHPGSRDVANIPGCPAHTDEINRFLAQLLHRRVRRPAPFYNHRGRVFQRGKLKYLTIRSSPLGVGVIISHTGVPLPSLKRWLMDADLGAAVVYESLLTTADGDEFVGRDTGHISGPRYLSVPLAGRTFELAPTAFFQANYSLSAGLIQAATTFSERGDLLIDLYGGFGAYSFAALKNFHEAIVVDGNASAIDAAQRQIASSKAKITAVCGSCEDFLSKGLSSEARSRVTHILVNPPRSGLSRTAATELGTHRFPNLKQLHYVSCSPTALARDLEVLRSQGLKITAARPFDMFPQTEHVEVVARLGVT